MGFNKGQFGSSAARARWRLQRVMASMWIIVSFTGWIVHTHLGSPLWLFPEIYLSILVVFQMWHWAAHQRWLFYPMWKVHVYHHWVVYPPKKFLSKVYQDDKAGRTILTSIAHDGPLYAGVASNLALLHAAGLTRPIDNFAALGFILVVAKFTNFIHHATHIEGHWMERFIYFHDLRALHYTHHQGTALHNFGMLDFTGDLLGQALFAPNYELSNRIAQKESHGPGNGTEHRSSVKPGPAPEIIRDGLEETIFLAIAAAVELIVGILGTLFGSVKVSPNMESAKPADSQTVAPSHWNDFFFFN